jgi:hypothetical protein
MSTESTSVRSPLPRHTLPLTPPPCLVNQKNLGLVATVFLPLTFLAGVFGMNFQQHGGSVPPPLPFPSLPL